MKIKNGNQTIIIFKDIDEIDYKDIGVNKINYHCLCVKLKYTFFI